MYFRDSGSLESTRLMQEILKKQPKFGSFTAFLHGLFPNCFLILTRCFYLYFLCLLFIFSYIVDYYIYKALKEQKKE